MQLALAPGWSFLGELIPDPLREDPLLARCGGETGMKRQRVGTAVARDIREEERVALFSAKVAADLRKAGFAPAVAAVEINKESGNSLPVTGQILTIGRVCRVEEIVV